MTIYIATAMPMNGDETHQGLTIYASSERDARRRALMIGQEVAHIFSTTAHVKVFKADSAGWRFPSPSAETVVDRTGKPITGYRPLKIGRAYHTDGLTGQTVSI